MGKRHLTPQEIKAHMNLIAKEKRCQYQSPYTATGIICAYSVYKLYGYKKARIMRLTEEIAELEQKWDRYEIELEPYVERLKNTAGWAIEQVDYTDADIKHPKGSFDWYMDHVQIDIENTINVCATRYLTWFYNCMIDRGFGEKRLEDLCEEVSKNINEYRFNRGVLQMMQAELLNIGVFFERPKDPKDGRIGTTMA